MVEPVLCHGNVVHFSKELEIGNFIKNVEENLTVQNRLVLDIVDYCDLHTNGFGIRVTADERNKDIRNRYGEDSELSIYYTKGPGMGRQELLDRTIQHTIKTIEYI